MMFPRACPECGHPAKRFFPPNRCPRCRVAYPRNRARERLLDGVTIALLLLALGLVGLAVLR